VKIGRLKAIVTTAFLACGVSSGTVSAANMPAYYPENYDTMIEASKDEGSLLIYSNIAEYNWREVFGDFSAKYPWIKIESIDLGPSTSFERYYSEHSVGKRTADLIVTGAPDGWHRFASKGALAPYVSPEDDQLPDWSRSLPGLYTVSTDPMIIIYNKLLLRDAPSSLKALQALAAENGRYRDKVTTYNATSNSFAYDIHWSVAKAFGDKAWSLFDELGSVTRSESGGSAMVEKVTSGEYVAGYFVSGITVFPRMSQTGRSKIMGWSLIEDGTPVFRREMGVTAGAKSPNSARLMLDYILSHEGQVAVGKSGLTPYRSDIKKGEVPYLSYEMIVDAVGEQNIIHVDYDSESYAERDKFLARWKQAFRIKN